MKRRGYGKKLLDESLNRASAMGVSAVLFERNIQFFVIQNDCITFLVS